MCWNKKKKKWTKAIPKPKAEIKNNPLITNTNNEVSHWDIPPIKKQYFNIKNKFFWKVDDYTLIDLNPTKFPQKKVFVLNTPPKVYN